MHQRTALKSREHGFIDGFGIGFLAENHAAAGAAKGFVRRRGHKIRIGYRALVQSGSHQTGDVSHIHHQKRPGFMSDLGHFAEVDLSRIGGSARNDHLRPVLPGQAADFLVIDQAGFFVYAVGHKMKILAAQIHGASVGQMAAVGQVHPQHHVAGLQHGEINRRIGLRAAVGLHVGVLGVEQLFGPVTGNILGYIHILTAAIVAPSRITFRIFVRQRGTHRLQNSRRNKIFRSDQFNMHALALHFVRYGLKNFGIHFL